MNKIMALVIGITLLTGSVVLAQPAAIQEVEVGNKICPVSGEKVGEMGDIVTIKHNGKVINLCCSMCEKDFTKNPDKYTKIAEDEVGR